MINTTRENLQIEAQISKGVGSAQRTDLYLAICRFFQVVFSTSSNVTHSIFFHFQFVFGVNLIHFFDGKNNRGRVRPLFCH